MPGKNTQNSIADSNFLGADQNGKPNLKISQEKAYQILSEGFVFTMEDDLKEALKRQKMKTVLIPDQARPTGKPEKFQPEKPYFDPFKTLSPDKSGVSIEAPATKPAEITPKKVFPVQPIEKPKEPIAESLLFVEEKSLPFKKVDILDREKQAEKERLAEEEIPQIIPEQEVVQKALAEKEKFEEQKKEREAVEAIRQEAKKQEEKEKVAKVSQAPSKKPEEFTKPASSLNVPVVPLKLAGKDWLKGIPQDSLPKIKQELSQKVLALLAELKKLALEERPFSEKRARILIKLREKNQILDRAMEQTEIVKERQKQIEDSEVKAQTPSQKHDLEQQRWQIEEKFKQAEEAQWLQEEEVEKFHLALAKIDLSLKDFQQKQTVLEKQKAQIQKFLAGLEFLKEKEILAEKIKANRKQIQFLESQQKTFLSQQKELDIQISAIKQQEQKIEERARAIEKQVQQTIEFRERRKLEQERWQVAEQRKIQEKKRWELEKNKEALLTKLQAVESRLSQEGEKEKYFLRKIQEIEAQIGEMPHLPALAKFWEVKIAPEIPKPAAPERQVSVQRQEPAKEQKIELLKPQAGSTSSLQAPLEALPLIRQETPEEQEVVEQIRLQAKAKEQELAMRAVKQQIEQEKRGITAEMRQKQEEEARQKSILAIKKLAEQEQKKAFLGKLKGPLLKEEILRKISKIYPKEEAQRQEFLERISQKTKPVIKQKVKGLEEGVVFHPMIRKTSLFEKIAVRILLVLLMAGIGIGVYMGVVALVKHNRNKPVLPGYQATSTFVATSTAPIEWPIVVPGGATTSASTSSLQVTATSTATTVSATTTSAFATSTLPYATSTAQVPASLIPVSKTHILSYQISGGVFYASFSQIMQSPVKSGSFEQIAVKDEPNNRFLTISQISGIMQVGFPQEIAQEDTTSTLLVFGSKFGNRLGFIVQTENTSTLSVSFRAWEGQAESQTEPIFSLMGKTGPALISIFKPLKYKTVLMRCQTFTKQDLGICYAIYKNYFIFISSFEQMARIVDKLP